MRISEFPTDTKFLTFLYIYFFLAIMFIFLMFICFWACFESHTAIGKPSSLKNTMLWVTHIFISECIWMWYVEPSGVDTLHSDMKSLNCVSSAAIFAYSSRRDALVAASHPLPFLPRWHWSSPTARWLRGRKPQRRRHWLSGRPNSEGIPSPFCGWNRCSVWNFWIWSSDFRNLYYELAEQPQRA